MDISIRVSGRCKQGCPEKLQISFPEHEDFPILTQQVKKVKGEWTFIESSASLLLMLFSCRELN